MERTFEEGEEFGLVFELVCSVLGFFFFNQGLREYLIGQTFELVFLVNRNFLAKSVNRSRNETELFVAILVGEMDDFLVLNFDNVDGSQNALLQGSVFIFGRLLQSLGNFGFLLFILPYFTVDIQGLKLGKGSLPACQQPQNFGYDFVFLQLQTYLAAFSARTPIEFKALPH